MSKIHTATIWVFAAAAISAIVYPGTPTAGARAATPAERPQTTAERSAPRHQSADNDDEIDTLQTIGASLAVDLSTEGLKRRAIGSLRRLQQAGEERQPAPENAVRYFKALVQLPIRPHSEFAKAKEAVNALEQNPTDNQTIRAAAASLDAFLARYFDTYALTETQASKDDVLLARDFEQIDKSALQLAILKRTVEDRNIEVRFLIATLPDPIDSYTGWQFDPMLDAITQAVAESDYILDRFHFPDSDKEDSHQGAGERGRLHELEPAIVVFKTHVSEDASHLDDAFGSAERKGPRAPFGDRLVLLIAHENPAAGIHARALANTLGLVIRSRHLTRDPDFNRGIAILGPTFSGSSEMLNRALLMAGARYAEDCRQTKARKCRVRIVSGSATDRQNKKTIEYDGGSNDRALDVTFQATVNPDDALLPELVRKVDDAKWSTDAAVLYEANTQYGRQLWETLSRKTVRSSFVQLPFPMNISRLRTTLESLDPARSSTLGLPSRFRPVPMESEGNPLDQIPQFNPKTAATYMELALAGTLDTIHREHVKTVGLMATDPRDKLFLAQQIARYSPDVSLFTAESDSVYVHPDYSPYLRGALVASTYPLYGANQRWSYAYQGASERRQFASSSAQGIYNAVLALLDYDDNGLPSRTAAPRLLEYGMPGKSCTLCTPPVWISVIGRSGAWPVRASLPPITRDQAAAAESKPSCAQAVAAGTNNPCNYVFAVKVPDGAPVEAGLRMFPSPLFHALLIFMTCALLVGWAAQGMAAATRAESWVRIEGVESDRRGYLLACVASVMLIQAFLWVLCLLRVRVEIMSGRSLATFVVASLGLLAGCHMMIRVLAGILREDREALRRVLRWKGLRMAAALTAVVVCGWSVVSLGMYLIDQALQGSALRPWGDVISFLSRAFDLRNGVSPTLPVLFLGSALTFWGLIELWRVRRGAVALTDPEVHGLLQHAVYTDTRTMASSWGSLNRSMLNVPRSGSTIAAFGLLAMCTFAFDPIRSLVSIEGLHFGRFVSATLLLVQVMLVLALVQLAFHWSRIRRLLGFMAHHELADAYERVPRDVFPITVFPRAPRLADLKIPVAHCAGRVGLASAVDAHAVGIPTEASDLEKTFRREMRDTPDRPWAASETWRALLDGALQNDRGLRSNRLLGSDARLRLAQMTPSSPGNDFVAKAIAEIVAADRALYQREADLPAMLITFVVRDALARLAPNLIFVTGGVILAFCTHTLFPFQQHTNLQALEWIYIAATFTTILTVLVQIKRNEIVARLTSISPGHRTTWDSGFVLKVTVFALIPLFTLFAAQFPDIGGVVLRWLEPLQNAVP